jgi:hypothetical protein
MTAALALALSLVAQDCNCNCNTRTKATNNRDVIHDLEPVPSARPGPEPDESWRPDLGPGERLVPGSIRHYRVIRVGDQVVRSEVQTVRSEVQSTPTPSTPAPQAVVPQVVVPQTYTAPMAAPSTSCYSSAYGGGYSYGAQTYSATPRAYSSPSPVYLSPPPVYSSPAPLYAVPDEPPPRRRRGGGPFYALRQRTHLRIAAEFGNDFNLGMGIGQHALGTCGPWGCR